ncbi:hypothetical protein TgHK011_001432 [Trichoderma gracile]|nr:hypothetical protein TgHK011_001432 [Trichoderma gracile]
MSENRRQKAKGGLVNLARGCDAQKLHVTAAWPINGVTNDLSLGTPRMQDTGAGAKKERKEATRAEHSFEVRVLFVLSFCTANRRGNGASSVGRSL